jgi:cytosine/creatinine deaminase
MSLRWQLPPAPWPQQVWLRDATLPRALLADADARRLPPALLSPENGRRAAVLLRDGRLAAIEPEPTGGAPCIGLHDAWVASAFVDPHTHLDKGDLLAMGLPVQRRLFDAIETVRSDYAAWTVPELRARGEFALRTAHAHGVRALNTYLDGPAAPTPAGAPRGAPLDSWTAFDDLRAAWKGRIELTLTSLVTIDALADPAAGKAIANRLAASRAVFGVFVYPAPHVPALIPRVFELADRFGLAVDFHVDEHLQPPIANLGAVVAAARARGLGARTVCGHACVLQALAVDARDALLDAVAAAGIGLVSLPATNLHLQDSAQDPPWSTPRWRGILPVHEARRRGITVAFGADNHRDPFYPAGDLDPLQTLALAASVAQLDDAAFGSIDTITTAPARLLRCGWDGRLVAGSPADLVIHAGRSSPEVLSRPGSQRCVVRHGQPLNGDAAMPPDPRELDRWREKRHAAPGPAQPAAGGARPRQP